MHTQVISRGRDGKNSDTSKSTCLRPIRKKSSKEEIVDVYGIECILVKFNICNKKLWDEKISSCSSEEQKDAIRYYYAWVLIHSRKPDDLYRGMNMLKGSVVNTKISSKQKKKEMYLLAVGYFRSWHYIESENFVSMCLEINPNCRKSLLLKEAIAYRYKQEGKKSSIFVDPPITSVEFVTGILEANPRSSHHTWGIEINKMQTPTLLTTPVNIGFLQKVPDWAHPITPQKYSQHPSEKTTSPLDLIEGKIITNYFAYPFSPWQLLDMYL
ncbi:mitochondrial fission 1 protein A [Tanacetum coccineum]